MSRVFQNIDPPLRPASVYPRLCWGVGGGHTRRAERGGESIFWNPRDIGLPSLLQ
jgi:hypothetical protein